MNTLTISEQTFDIPSKFAEGHVLTASEARALNAYRAELISHGFRKEVKEAVEKGTFDQAAMQEKINAKAATYEFGLSGGGKRLDPIAREAQVLAVEHLKNVIEKKGSTVSAYKKANPEKYAELLDQVASAPAILEKAKKIVASRAKNAVDIGELEI